MENLQTECKAFDAAIKCAEKDIRLEKLKIKTRKVSVYKRENNAF